MGTIRAVFLAGKLRVLVPEDGYGFLMVFFKTHPKTGVPIRMFSQMDRRSRQTGPSLPGENADSARQLWLLLEAGSREVVPVAPAVIDGPAVTSFFFWEFVTGATTPVIMRELGLDRNLM